MANIISTLPDEILCYILSFIPTKEAAATSVLSKRWRSLWLSVPALDLHNPDLACIVDQKTFLEFVYFTIFVRPINRFSLTSSAHDNGDLYPHIKIWLDAAAKRRMDHIHVDLRRSGQSSWNFPASIFSCRTLVVLKLGKCNVTGFSASSVYLPSLKILHLNDVNFAESRHYWELLCGCPVLEDLETDAASHILYGTSLRYPLVRSKALRKLVRASFGSLNISLEAASNPPFRPSMILEFPKLTRLELFCDSKGTYYLLFSMLKYSCPKLQTFTLQMGIQFDSRIWFYPFLCSVPECISSQLKSCSFIEFEGKENEMTFAKYIIQNSRSLQTMKIKTNLL